MSSWYCPHIPKVVRCLAYRHNARQTRFTTATYVSIEEQTRLMERRNVVKTLLSDPKGSADYRDGVDVVAHLVHTSDEPWTNFPRVRLQSKQRRKSDFASAGLIEADHGPIVRAARSYTGPVLVRDDLAEVLAGLSDVKLGDPDKWPFDYPEVCSKGDSE